MSLLKRIEKERQTTGQEPSRAERPSRMSEMRVRRQPASPARDAYLDLKTRKIGRAHV